MKADIDAVSIEACREKFKSFLAARSLRVTGQRLAIFDAAFGGNGDDHYTAEDLLDRARVIDESVSRATVYRTLPIMTESGLLREIDIGKNLKFYVANPDNETQQAQVICLDCDRIFEISAPFMEWYRTTVTAKLGLTPVAHRLQVHAKCDVFGKTGKCPHRN